MKNILLALMLLPLLSVAQKKSSVFYGTAMLYAKKTFNSKTPAFGGSATAGARFSNFGICAGAEVFKIFSDLKAAIPVYADARYFFKKAEDKQVPFIAVNAGKLILNANNTFGGPTDNATFYYKGKGFFALEAGMKFSAGQNKRGLLVSAALRRFGYASYTVHKTSIYPNGSIGPVVETKSNSFTENFTELALKIGYQF